MTKYAYFIHVKKLFRTLKIQSISKPSLFKNLAILSSNSGKNMSRFFNTIALLMPVKKAIRQLCGTFQVSCYARISGENGKNVFCKGSVGSHFPWTFFV